VTPQEYAVRAVRAWITNVDLDTIPELQPIGDEHPQGAKIGNRRDRFIEQVLNATQEMVGVLTYAVIAERQDEEWQHFAHAVDQGEVENGPLPVRYTGKGEVIR
jgi:hypothetical protein